MEINEPTDGLSKKDPRNTPLASTPKEVSVQPIFRSPDLNLKSKIGPVDLGITLKPVVQLKDRGPLDPKLRNVQPMVKLVDLAPVVIISCSQAESPNDKKEE